MTTIQEHCCGADTLFDQKRAKKELSVYKKKGAKGITKKLFEAMVSYNNENATLLDIGGGIGILQWEFIKKNGLKTTHVDASSGYLEIAHEYAIQQGWEDRTVFIKSDFLECFEQVDTHDAVTLDKVVCCYPEYERLLTSALSKCNKTLALTFPMGGPFARFIANVVDVFLNLKGNAFRPFIHSPTNIRETILTQGFRTKHQSTSFPWHIEVYERI